ncbi:stage II sporulation protein M [Paenibacillus sp. FSL W8-0186]|uniref:stage II sporulation protein M n=1 Tax=Paenibacillus sp. FSL W8-0186 TaxID=2921709 RepID=UPI0030D25BED
MRNYLHRNRWFLLASAGWLLFSYFAGWAFVSGMSNEIGPSSVVSRQIDHLDNSVLPILFQNLFTSALLISGLFSLSLPTIIILFLNGFWFGASLTSRYMDGVSAFELALKIVPHGIFEIPALIIAGFVGFQGITFYIHKHRPWVYYLKSILVMCSLLICAALVEGLITSKL